MAFYFLYGGVYGGTAIVGLLMLGSYLSMPVVATGGTSQVGNISNWDTGVWIAVAAFALFYIGVLLIVVWYVKSVVEWVRQGLQNRLNRLAGIVKVEPTNQNIKVTIFEYMDQNSYNRNTVQLFTDTPEPISSTVNYPTNNEVLLNPLSPLGSNQSYTLRIWGTRDLAGNRRPDYSLTFKPA